LTITLILALILCSVPLDTVVSITRPEKSPASARLRASVKTSYHRTWFKLNKNGDEVAADPPVNLARILLKSRDANFPMSATASGDG